MTTIEAIQLIELAFKVANTFGVNRAKYDAMVQESGGELTSEQIQELSDDASASIDRL